MRYTEKTDIHELRQKYDYLIGWGVGRKEYCLRYNPSLYQLDYLIDGLDREVGSVICGMKVSPKSILKKFMKDSNPKRKICFILFPNPEYEILAQIMEYLEEFDFIVSRLIELDSKLLQNYSAGNEDIILFEAAKKFKIIHPFYVDIGVCHPVIRNNTYLFYENGFYDGLLIEPNHDMCELASVYRPKNKIVPVGACAGKDGVLKYYIHPDPSYKGYNTFNVEKARTEGFENSFVEVSTININDLLKENCTQSPDILDIDTEGMDYELINELDTEMFRIKIICLEGERRTFDKLLGEKGYIHYASTVENNIYIAQELLV